MTDYLDHLITAPRTGALITNRAGDVMMSVSTLNKEGKKYRTQIFAIAQAGTELTKPVALTTIESNAKLLALAENGDLYLTLDKDIDEAESKSLKGIWKLGKRGEPQLVFSYPGGISNLQVRDTAAGRRLIFTAQHIADSLQDQAQLLDAREKNGASAVLYDSFPTRFWDHDLGLGTKALYLMDEGSEPRRLSLPTGVLEGYEVSPDSTRALVTLQTKVRGIHPRSSVYLIDLEQDAPAQLIAEGEDRAVYSAGAFSPDGSRAFIYRTEIWLPGQSLDLQLFSYTFATGALTRQGADVDRWPSDALWLDDQRFAFATDHLGAGAIFVGTLDGETRQLIETGTTHYSSLGAGNGQLIALRDSILHSPEPVIINPETAEETLLPTPVKTLRGAGKLEKIKTVAEDGTTVTAWLALPETAEHKLPLVTFAHGGPWGSWNSWTYRWNPWVLTQAGYAVLLPDPAISLGYGRAMLDRGGDAIGDTPYTDIMALIEVASARTDIDGDNAAFMGGSYGGYMTNWVAGHAGTRFKCYVTHASLFNMQSMYFTTDNGTWHEWMYEPENGQRNSYSPHEHIENVQAPVLVIHGDKDYRVPIGEGLALWAALNRHSSHLGHKYLYYPDEGHWILKPENSRLWYQTVRAWLDTHLLGRAFETPKNLGYTARSGE
ncbi:S9 family peptidase [Rothia sp. ZJ932]|uniref:S9 family peptidase n=1 Tax=Rothia sp. ZJ932 TaxID=2810516 RepID=UPI001967CEBB|nr:S9 family peptidase [Rothia sp. ZJ932]QRZ62179.1 S9 family peptidase [Rothia sp. ZJ932]